MKIHHIGYLVKDIHKAIQVFIYMGYEIQGEIVKDEYRGIYIAFLDKDGYCVEAVSPFREGAVVSELLQKMGCSPYHICYEVSDLEQGVREFEQKNFIVIQEAHEAVALENRKVVFMWNRQIGMIELVG